MKKTLVILASGAALSALLIGASAVAAPVPTSAPKPAGGPSDPPVPEIPQRYLDQEVDWSVCPFDAQIKRLYPEAPTTNCATVKVPMDWNNPDAHPDVKVAIAYSRATGTSRGLMTSNPGGPGGAGLTLSAALAVDKPRLFEDYDLLGFDPRGFGQSERLRCLTTSEELEALPTTPDYRERTRQTHRTEVAEAKLLAKACSATEFGQFVSSQQTVYDMEFLRQLLESRRVSFIGYSYGTWLGGWYADTYPNKVDRFVLDSNMDWTHTQWANVNFDPFSSQRRRDTQLFPWIARQADLIQGLGESPRQVTKSYEKIRAKAVELVKAGKSQMRGDDLDGRLYSASYGNTRFIRATLDILVHDEFVEAPAASGKVENSHIEKAWARISPELQKYDTLAAFRARYGVAAPAGSPTSALAAAAPVKTRQSILADARQKAAKRAGDEVVDLGAIGTTVRCNDTEWRHNASYYLREADRNARKYPFFGYLVGVPMCGFWQYGPQDRELDLTGSPRMLMISSEMDPATAYEGALRTHEDTARHTRFVGIDDEGQHGQYIGGPSSCVEDIGDRFVFSGELPGKDLICGTSPLPEEGSVYSVDGPVDGNGVPLPRRSASATDAPNPMLQQILDRVAAEAPLG